MLQFLFYLRSKIFLKLMSGKRDFEFLNATVNELKIRKNKAQKPIIFCTTAMEVENLYFWFFVALGKERYEDETNPTKSNLLINQYTGSSGSESKKAVLSRIRGETSCRLLICTIAFGMGVDIRDVRKVIIWGLPASPVTMWQEIGRAGRDKDNAEAIIILFRSNLFARLKEVVCVTRAECLRYSILKQFYEFKDIKPREHQICKNMCTQRCICTRCECCSVCRNSCECWVKENVAK